mgnify:CR=1 FL=1
MIYLEIKNNTSTNIVPINNIETFLIENDYITLKMKSTNYNFIGKNDIVIGNDSFANESKSLSYDDVCKWLIKKMK